jgi:protein-disulfide isomerase
MSFRRSATPLVALLALLALAALATPQAHRAAPPAPTPAPPPTAALPAEALEGLDDAQQKLLTAWAGETFCYCGCPHTVSQCLREHGKCRHAGRMLNLAARLVRAGAKKDEVSRLVASYYASFDRRPKLDVKDFGPPLGSPDAPVTIVEFSDFTCPYCQMMRPALESFVQARKGRVKLVYKPFPIESHPGALDLAQAGEWARDQGKFWEMHDALFASPGSHTPDELAALAAEHGLDGDALKAALEKQTYLPRIRASMGEARTAGIKGTPSLFFNGRPLVLMDYTEEGLELTLQDEEEWVKSGGWQRD